MDFSQKFEFGSGLAWSGLAGSKVSTAAHFSCHCQPLWSPPTAAFLQKTVAHLISEAASKMKYKNTRQKLTTSRHQDQSITPFFHSHSQDAWWHTATDPLPCSMFRSARQRCDGPSPPPASRPPLPGPRPPARHKDMDDSWRSPDTETRSSPTRQPQAERRHLGPMPLATL